MRQINRQRLITRATAVSLLLLFWGRLLATAVQKSATFDEILHILHGVLYWQQWQLHSVVQNPPLTNLLMGLPVSLLFHPNLPTSHPAWSSGDWLTLSKAFMWEINSNGLLLIWSARWVIMLFALLLGALLFRWSARLFRTPWAGLLALFLFTFDPNILAHAMLATTDLGMAFFFTLAAFMVWLYWARWPAHKGIYLATAVALGAVLAAKFSGIVLLIGLALLLLWRLVSERPSRPQALRWIGETIGWLLIAVTIFLLLYRFQLPPLLDDFRIQQEHQLTGHDAFFMGQISRDGWWAYFPTVFLIKTPIPTLILLLVTAVRLLTRRQWQQWPLVWLWLLIGGIAAAGLTSRVNIGYRYLLPLLPLAFVLMGQVARGKWQVASGNWSVVQKWALAALLAVFALRSLAIHPHYLAYFNAIAGGPDNGWRWVVDSNLDWGQDLVALAAYAQENPEPMQAAWLGTAPLTAYGIANATPMPLWPHGREDPTYDPFYPPQPAAGTYVLSATQLQGVYLKNKARFAWFQNRPPDDKLGYSLFVYRIPAQGVPVGLALSGIAMPDVGLADVAATGSNDWAVRWFDGRSSLLWPGGGESLAFTAVGAGHLPTDPLLQALYTKAISRPGVGQPDRQYQWAEWTESPITAVWQSGSPHVQTSLGWSPEAQVGSANWANVQPLETAVFDHTFRLLGIQTAPTTPEQPLRLLTLWRVMAKTERPLKLFVHLLDENGQIVAQHDGLDVRTPGLQPGDEFAQLHTIPLPPGYSADQLHLQIGVYDAATGQRLPLDDLPTERVLLRQ